MLRHFASRILLPACVLLASGNLLAQTWEAVAPILQMRGRPGVAELPDGKILIFGGELTQSVLTECEIYDPQNDTWALTGNLNVPRFWSGVATLPDGTIFVAGGCTNIAGSRTNSCEIYNPSTGIWSPAPSMARERASFNITTLPDSNLLIIGGIDSTSTDFSNVAEEYDVHSSAFVSISQPQPSFYGYQAVYSSDLNGIVLAGGELQSAFQSGGLELVQLYDINSGTWKSLPNLPEPVMGFHQLIETPDKKIALLSGRSSFLNTTKDVQLFDPSSNTWSIAGSLVYGHDYANAYLVNGDSVLVIAGLFKYATRGAEVPTSWYNTRTGISWPGPVPIVPRTSQGAIMITSPANFCSPTQSIYLFAGVDTLGNMTSVSERLTFIYPAQPATLHRESASAYYGGIDSLPLGVDLSSQINIDSLWPFVTEITGTYAWDSSVVSFAGYDPPSNWTLNTISNHRNSLDFDIQNNGSSATTPLDLGMALFRPASDQVSTTWVSLSTLSITVGGEQVSLCIDDNEDNHWAVKSLGVLSGVEEVPSSEDVISVYPNPAQDEIIVAEKGLTSVELVNSLGVTIPCPFLEKDGEIDLDVSNLSGGIYFMAITSAGYTRVTKVAIIH